MAKIKLNQKAVAHAEYEIKFKEVDKTDGDWQALQATEDEIDKYLETHDTDEYGLWFLGMDVEVPADSKEHYVFPYGDLKLVYRSALVKIQKEAAEKKLHAIEEAAKQLLQKIDNKK
jgi:hypothetical protein